MIFEIGREFSFVLLGMIRLSFWIKRMGMVTFFGFDVGLRVALLELGSTLCPAIDGTNGFWYVRLWAD